MTIRLVLPSGPGGAATGVPGTVNFVIDGLGSPIVAGIKADIWMPFKGLWQGVTLLADQNGSCQVDLWQADYSSFPPTVANSIVDGNPPAFAGADSYQDLLLSGWTKNFGPNSVIRCNVVASSIIERLTVALKFVRT